MTVKLSTVKPDFDDIYGQLVSSLAQDGAWKDLIEASTGQIILKFIAGIGAYNQYSIERSVQENFLESARGSQSIYAMTRDLGVRISRKKPSKVTVSITRNSTSGVYSIPSYSEFEVDGKYKYINRVPITFDDNVETVTDIELEEGELYTHSFTSDGTSFQKFYLGEKFESSDSLIRVFVDNEEWERVDTGVWTVDVEEKKFSDSTTILGESEITFGNNVNGLIPTISSTITVHEYKVKGSIVNSAISGLKVSLPNYFNLTGITTSPITGGANEKGSDFYKEIGARLGRALQRAVTRSDYISIIKTYGDVIDANALGEQDLHPGNQNWMSTVGIYLITESGWENNDVTKQTEFLNWLKEKSILGVYPIIEPTTPIVTNITAQLIVNSKNTTSNLTQIVDRGNNALTNAYGTAQQRLGKSIYMSDIIDVLLSVSGVDHVNLTAPTTNIAIDFNEYFKLGNITLTATYV